MELWFSAPMELISDSSRKQIMTLTAQLEALYWQSLCPVSRCKSPLYPRPRPLIWIPEADCAHISAGGFLYGRIEAIAEYLTAAQHLAMAHAKFRLR